MDLSGVNNSIDEIIKESNELRSGTLSKINELEHDIALIIAEYDDDIVKSADIDKEKYLMSLKESEGLSSSVRMIKIKNM